MTFLAGVDNITAVAFTSVAGITADVNGVAGADIVWTLVGPTQIKGAIGGIDAIRIDLTPPSLPIVHGTSGSATVTVTLLDNFPHPNAAGQNIINLTGLTVVATDTDGDTAAATVAVNVTDDVPTAVADTDGVTEGQIATGNVITDASLGDAGDSDTGADTRGADGATVTAIASNNPGGDPLTAVGAGVTIDGQYGALTINPDGSYSYAANSDINNAGPVTETFTYTLTDGDGDATTTTLAITIGDGANPSVTQNATIAVDEEGLGNANATGSAAATTVETNTGTVTFLAGVDNITAVAFTSVAGITADVNGVAGADIVWTLVGPTQIKGAIGGIDAIRIDLTPPSLPIVHGTSGSATVTVTLLDNFPHPNAAGQNIINLTGLTVVATDTDGDTAAATVAVNVTDDAPTAVADTDGVTEGQIATGNVITDASLGDAGDSDTGADTRGADGATVTAIASNNPGGDPLTAVGAGVTIDGQYGALTINPDGSYSYAANSDINNAGPVTETFTYTLTDGDGDATTTTLAITIGDGANPSVTQNATIAVDEEGLGNANATGSAAATTVETNTGTVTFLAGVDNITAVAFTSVAGITADVNGVAGADIVWTLVGPTQIKGAIGGIDAIRIDLTPPSLPIVHGTSGSATVTVTLLDNFPHPNAAGQNIINLTGLTVVATDTDGDTAAATVAVNVTDDVPTAVADTDGVTEGQIATGNVITDASLGDAGDSDTGADTRGADGATVTAIASNNPGGDPLTAVGAGVTIDGQYGALTINPDGSYSYAANSDINNAGPVTETFTYTLTDGDGDATTTTLAITIGDGANPSVTQNATIAVDEEGLGNANATGSAAATTVETNTGTVTFLAGVDNITAVAFTSVAGITADVNGVAGADIVWTLVGPTQIKGAIGGIDAIRIDLTPPSLPIVHGTSGSATVTVTLLDNFPHPNAAGQNIINLTGLTVVATDTDGDTAAATVAVNVTDDVPTAVADTDGVTEGQIATGNVITDASLGDAGDSDTGADTRGADGATVTAIASNNPGGDPLTAVGAGVTIDGQYGALTINPDGSYSYAANSDINNAGPVTETFTYTLTDGDGDATTTTLAITIGDGANPSVTQNATIAVDEEGLGNANATGSAAATTVETNTGTVTFLAGVDNITAVAFTSVAGITADVNGVAGADIVWTLVGPTQIKGAIGGIDAIRIDLTPPSLPIVHGTSGSATVTVTLLDNFPHPNAAGQNIINLTGLTVVATDTDGDTAAATVAVNVTDDVPTANPAGGSGSVTFANTNLVINLDISGSMGTADGPGGMTRLETAKASILELLEQYDALGNVKVELVTFSDFSNRCIRWLRGYRRGEGPYPEFRDARLHQL